MRHVFIGIGGAGNAPIWSLIMECLACRVCECRPVVGGPQSTSIGEIDIIYCTPVARAPNSQEFNTMSTAVNANTPSLSFAESRSYHHLTTEYDESNASLWCFMHAQPRPCFSSALLAECRKVQRAVLQSSHEPGAPPIEYLVLASGIPGVFNLGGDLAMFMRLIKEGEREALDSYAKACVEVSYHQSISFGLPMMTIALVQGDALGGGFEAALSCNLIVAERGTQFGLPEVLFNLFPGMGAFTFLSRRLDAVRAERLILSGKIYSAEELYDMGVVDELAEPGDGVAAVDALIDRRRRRPLAFEAMRQVRQQHQPVTYGELLSIAELWVDTALKLSPKDLRTISRLIKAQDLRQTGRATTIHTQGTQAAC
jgi:DSF synthase